MLVHFIGGPAHGRTEAMQRPGSVLRMAESKPQANWLAGEDFPALSDCPFTEHEYRIIRYTPRYAIAEWQAPPVDVRFELRATIEPFDSAANEIVRRLFLDRTRAKNGVRCLGAHITNSIELQLELTTRVEGPEDATALQLASEKVQHYIDAELPALRQYITQVAATT